MSIYARFRMPNGRGWQLCVLFIALCGSAAAEAVTYRWRDAAGHMQFSDTPPSGVRAEIVDIRSPPSKLTPNQAQGEIQRLRTLREGQAAAASAETQRKTSDAATAEATLAARAQKCAGARWALAALDSGRPVYRDGQGMFRIKRPPGQGDAYAGARQYLDDASRAQEITAQKRLAENFCGALPTKTEKRRTEDEIKMAETCEAAAADLARLQRPEAHATPAQIEVLQRYLSQCRR